MKSLTRQQNKERSTRRHLKKKDTEHTQPTDTFSIEEKEEKDKKKGKPSKIYLKDIIEEIYNKIESESDEDVETVLSEAPKGSLTFVYNKDMTKHELYDESHPERPERLTGR